MFMDKGDLPSRRDGTHGLTIQFATHIQSLTGFYCGLGIFSGINADTLLLNVVK